MSKLTPKNYLLVLFIGTPDVIYKKNTSSGKFHFQSDDCAFDGGKFCKLFAKKIVSW